MTEDKPIAKPMIDDATREKMALMFSVEVYLPDDVDGFFDLQAAQRDLQLELNATPLTHPKRRTELMQAFFGAAGRACTSKARCTRTGAAIRTGASAATPTSTWRWSTMVISSSAPTPCSAPTSRLQPPAILCVRTCATGAPSIRVRSTSAKTSGSTRSRRPTRCARGPPECNTRSGARAAPATRGGRRLISTGNG